MHNLLEVMGTQAPQQSLLSSFAGLAQTGVTSALNPLLQAIAPSPAMQLIPNMPQAHSPPAYFTPQPGTPMAQQGPTATTSIPPHILQQMLAAAMQGQPQQVPPQPHQSSELPPVPDHDDLPLSSPSTSVPFDLVIKLLEIANLRTLRVLHQ